MAVYGRYADDVQVNIIVRQYDISFQFIFNDCLGKPQKKLFFELSDHIFGGIFFRAPKKVNFS